MSNRNKITVVLDLTEEDIPADQPSVRIDDIIPVIENSLPGIKIIGARQQDTLTFNDALIQYLEMALGQVVPDEGAKALQNMDGITFWQFPGDFWADNSDMLQATIVYRGQEALMNAEGDMQDVTIDLSSDSPLGEPQSELS